MTAGSTHVVLHLDRSDLDLERFLQVRGIYIRCVVASLHVPYCFFLIRVVSEFFGLKGVLLARIMKVQGRPSLSNHLNGFQGIIDQMLRMGIKFEDEILGLLLLNSLPESWETFKVSITNSTPNGVVSLQMVKGSVLNEEMRRKAQGSSS
ncbi:hypothetical protein CR513_47221, partial [Mucuna pruriens]